MPKKYSINRIKDVAISHLNQVWTTDITYIRTKMGSIPFNYYRPMFKKGNCYDT